MIVRDQFGFANIAKIRIKITKEVSYKDIFFLINNFFKTLLRMLFISKIKIAINYKL
jgi:hypothetical protein